MVVIIRAPIARARADSIMPMPWKAVARALKGLEVYDMKGAVYLRGLGERQACAVGLWRTRAVGAAGSRSPVHAVSTQKLSN